MIRRRRQENRGGARRPRQTASPPLPAPLSPRWAFVVQLREGTALTAQDLHGRIEHIVSGQMTDFTSVVELHAFMTQVLSELQKKPP